MFLIMIFDIMPPLSSTPKVSGVTSTSNKSSTSSTPPKMAASIAALKCLFIIF